MAPASVNPRPRHANSPFLPRPEPTIEIFGPGDPVCHDSHGLGRVKGVDAGGATVDFGGTLIRIETPFRKMTKL